MIYCTDHTIMSGFLVNFSSKVKHDLKSWILMISVEGVKSEESWERCFSTKKKRLTGMKLKKMKEK